MAVNTPQASAADSQASPDSGTGEIDLLGETPIWTPEIQRLMSAVCAMIRMGFPGMSVDGKQRCGKSFACEYLRDTLPVALGYSTATFIWSIPEFCKTERDFVQERLRDSNCSAVTHRDIAVLRNRLYDHMIDHAVQIGSRKIVIIVDEAHFLTREQYHYLVHCDNSMRLRKFKPFFVLVGQPELRSATSSWVQSSGFQVVGRFFSQQHCYMGIAMKDVPQVVAGFDEPEGDGDRATYAKALPDAFEGGWRLSRVAPLLVQAIESVALKHNITNGLRVPMQSLRAMLLSILYQFIDRKRDPGTFDIKMALKAVSDSGFAKVMEFYVQAAEADEADEMAGEKAA